MARTNQRSQVERILQNPFDATRFTEGETAQLSIEVDRDIVVYTSRISPRHLPPSNYGFYAKRLTEDTL